MVDDTPDDPAAVVGAAERAEADGATAVLIVSADVKRGDEPPATLARPSRRKLRIPVAGVSANDGKRLRRHARQRRRLRGARRPLVTGGSRAITAMTAPRCVETIADIYRAKIESNRRRDEAGKLRAPLAPFVVTHLQVVPTWGKSEEGGGGGSNRRCRCPDH